MKGKPMTTLEEKKIKCDDAIARAQAVLNKIRIAAQCTYDKTLSSAHLDFDETFNAAMKANDKAVEKEEESKTDDS